MNSAFFIHFFNTYSNDNDDYDGDDNETSQYTVMLISILEYSYSVYSSSSS